jgi:hypothetical protein
LNPLEHILKKYNTHPVFSNIAMILVVIVGIGQVTDSLDKTINFAKEHFTSSRLEATFEQKNLFIDEALKPTQLLLSSNNLKKAPTTTSGPKIKHSVVVNKQINLKSKEISSKPRKTDSRFISEAPLSKIKNKIRAEELPTSPTAKANSISNRFDRLQAIRKTIREEGT